MRIVCPSCEAKYNLDDSRVPSQGASIKCPKCKHSFIVKPGIGALPPPPAPKPPSVAPPPPAPSRQEPASAPVPLPGQMFGDTATGSSTAENTVVSPAPQTAPSEDHAVPLPGQNMLFETDPPAPAAEMPPPPPGETAPPAASSAGDILPPPPASEVAPPPPVGEPDDDLSMDDIFGDDFDQPETTVIEQQETSMEELADIFGGPPTPPTGAEIQSLTEERAAVTSDEGDVSWPSEDAMPATSSNFTDDGFGVSESDAPPTPTQQSMADGVLDFIDQSASPDQAQLGDMYRIRKRSGAEIGPFDEATVLELFREGELKGNEHASIDGVNWRPLAQNPAFTEAITEAMSNAMSGFDLSSTGELTAAEENVDNANDGSRRLIALVASILLVLVGGVLAEFVTDYGWFAYRLFSGEDPNAELQQVLNEKEVLVVDLPDFKQPPLELLKPDSYPLYRAGIKDARAILKEGKKYYAKAKKNYDARVALLDEDQVRPPEPKMPKDAIIAAAQMGRFASHLYLIARSATFKKEMMDALDVKQKYKVGASWLWATITATLHYTNGKIEQGIESLKSHVDPQSKLKGEGLTEVNFWTGFGYLQKQKYEKAILFFDRALQSEPLRILPNYYQAKTLLAMGQREAAMGYLQKVLELQKDHRRANLMQAQLQIDSEKTSEEGMELLKKLSEGMWADDMAPMHRADAFLSRARVRQKEHAYQEALIYLEQAAQQAPSREDILLSFANLALKMLDYKKAVLAFERIRKLNSRNVDAIEGVLMAKLAQGDTKGAFDDAAASVKRLPKEARLHFWYGMIAKKLLDLDLAAREFQEARKLDPSYPGPAVENILDKMSRGVYEGATNEAQKALVEVQEKSRPAIRTAMAAVMIKQRKYEQARVQLTTAIKENDSYLNAWMRLIDLMRILEEKENVEKLKIGLLKRDPKGFRSHIAKGMLEHSFGDYESAIDEYESAYNLAKDNYEILLWAGESAFANDDYGHAKTFVDQAYALRPKSPTVHVMKAKIERVTDPKSSARTLLAGIELTEEDPHLPYELGLSYNQIGAYLEAVDAFDKAIALSPDFANAHYNKGLALKDLKRTTGAVASFRETIKIESNRADAHLQIAEILTGMGDAMGALRAFKGAINAEPDKSEARCRMGQTLIARLGENTGYLKKGVRMMERCVMMDKKYPHAFKYLGHAYRQLTVYRKAIAAYKKHLSVNPYDVENEMIREFLEEMGVDTMVVEELEEDERRMAEERARGALGAGMPGMAPPSTPPVPGSATPTTPTNNLNAPPANNPSPTAPSGTAPLQPNN